MKIPLQMARTLYRESSGVRTGIITNMLCGIATVAFSLLTVWLTHDIVATACLHLHHRLATLSVVLCLILLLRILTSKSAQRIEAWCITRFSNNMRSRLFARLMTGSVNSSSELHSADIVNRLSTDVGNVSAAICSTLPATVISAASMIGAFVFLAMLTPAIAVIVTMLMPVAIVIGKLSASKSHWLTKEIRNEETSMQKLMQEAISHRVLISTLAYSSQTCTDFDIRQSAFYRLAMRRNDLAIYAGGMVTLGFTAGYALMLLYCAFGLVDGSVSFATMTALLQLVGMVQKPAVDLSQKISPFVKAAVSIERLNEIKKIYPSSPPYTSHTSSGVNEISLEHIWVRYNPDSEYTLRDLSVYIPEGQATAIYGETGSGKTTLLRLMLGICHPDKGRISSFVSPDYSNVIYVPQGNTLMSGTILSNLLMGKPDADENEIEQALYISAAQFASSLPAGLMTPCGENGHGLSEGQSQRLAIARGILRLMSIKASTQPHAGHHPILLLLDEPTSALDADTEKIMLDRLIPYLNGVTVVIVTHKRSLKKYVNNEIIICTQ